MFTYSHICPRCGETFESTRKKPYLKPRVTKVCATCKEEKNAGDIAIEFGGQGCEQRCETCVHFGVDVDRPVNQFWQACGQRKWSVDGEGFLVYFEDLCEEYEPYEDD